MISEFHFQVFIQEGIYDLHTSIIAQKCSWHIYSLKVQPEQSLDVQEQGKETHF